MRVHSIFITIKSVSAYSNLYNTLNNVEPATGGFAHNLMNYNSSSNYFTCPCDGYLRVNSWGMNSAIIYTLNGFDFFASAGQQSCLFLKKGCRVYCTVTATEAIQVHFFACK